ncbi:MAG TPA: hypothetical protein VKY24_04705 [Reyranella sp.]|nr:hypothetical protein [Reyranella sp.]
MSDDSFADLVVPTVAVDPGRFGDDTVFAPFMLRFRPFIAGADSAKMPSYKAFDASTSRNPV